MRFLGVSETCDLGALYMRLAAEGHEVKVAITEPLARGTMRGIVEQVDDWRSELDWVGRDGIILFEAVSTGFGALQDNMRRQGYRVIGGSDFGDRLENDRSFGQKLLEDLGFPRGLTHTFTSLEIATDFVVANPGRYALKFCGGDRASHDNYISVRPDGTDLLAMLHATVTPGETFILQSFIDGVEMGVGAYFNGHSFMMPACLDWEHKRFFAGDLGELTGEMGTVATFGRSRRFFEETLLRVEPWLRQAGHVGYVNLNTIVNGAGIYPLEFTCRFGYPGFAVLTPLQTAPWGELLEGMVGGWADFPVAAGFSTGIVITTPPFPYSRHEIDERVGLPVLVDEADSAHLHYGEIGRAGDQLVTSGLYGWTMVVTGTGATIREASAAAYDRVGRIFTPHMRYRLDIGETLASSGLPLIEALGWLD